MGDAPEVLHAVATAPLEGLAGRRLLVLLHGYGADERDLLPLGAELGGEDAVVSLRGPVPVGAGAAWADPSRGDVLAGAGLEAAADRVLATLDAIAAQAGAPAAVRLLGFSQGGALALVVAGREPDRFDRVAVLSGFVPAAWADSGPARLPRVLWASGDADEVIPAAAVERTRAWLAAHADAEVRRYPGLGHGVGAAEMEDVAAFLA